MRSAADRRGPAAGPLGRRLSLAIGTAVLCAIAGVIWHITHRARPSFETGGRAETAVPQQPVPVAPSSAPQPASGVTGHVLLPDGSPAAGVRVTLYRARRSWPDWDPEYLEGVVSSYRGEFRFTTPPSPDLLVGFELSGFAGDLVEAPPQVHDHELRLEAGHSLSGYVSDSTGKPLPGCRVALEPLPGDDRRTAVTDSGPDGRYEFVDVRAGAVRVVARHPNWQPAFATNVVIGARASVDLRFDRPAVILRGTVVTAGQPPRPVANARVLVVPQTANHAWLEPMSMLANQEGRFEIGGIGRGNYLVEIRHPDYSTVQTTIAVGVSPPPQRFELVPRSRVRGRITAPTREGFRWPRTILLRSRDGELARTAVAADGAFSFDDEVSVGWATLELTGGEAAFAASGTSVMKFLVEELAANEIEPVIVAPTRIRGRVVGATGEPIAGAKVFAAQAEQLAAALRATGSALIDIDLRRLGNQIARAAAPIPVRLLAVSGDDGRFEITGLQAGAFVLRVECRGYATATVSLQIEPAPRATEIGDIELVPSLMLSGRVERNGAPLPGAVVTVIGADSPAQGIAGPDGTYEVAGLRPGRYRLRARYSGLSPLSRDVVLDASRRVDFSFPPGRIVTGIVIGSDGQPVEGALVMVRGAQGPPTATDAGGTFAIELPDRRVELQVFLGDRNALAVQTVEVSDRRVTIPLEVPATTSLRAKVSVLPGRTHPSSVLLKVAPLADGDGSAAQARVLELQNGELLYPWLPAVPSRLTLCAEGYAPFVRDLPDPTPGVDVDLGDILLEPGASVRGRVVDREGKPIPGCSVFLGDEADLDLFTPGTRSDADGAFTCGGVSMWSRFLVAKADGYATKTVELSLPRDALRADPLPVVLDRGATIEIEAPGSEIGTYVLLLRGGRVVGSAELDSDGLAVFPNRAPGSYTVKSVGEDPKSIDVAVERSEGVVRASLK